MKKMPTHEALAKLQRQYDKLLNKSTTTGKALQRKRDQITKMKFDLGM